VTAHTRVSLAPDLEVEEALLSLRKPMVAAGQPVLPAPATTRALISHWPITPTVAFMTCSHDSRTSCTGTWSGV
jgi:hypothetical protein